MSQDNPFHPPAHPPTALLAEDDELIREIVCLYLKRLGFEVLEADNGKTAIELLQQRTEHPLDLLVTDLLMPGASGEVVIRSALSNGACQRFLIISGFANQMNELDPALREHAQYIEKPFTYSAFQATVEELAQKKAVGL